MIHPLNGTLHGQNERFWNHLLLWKEPLDIINKKAGYRTICTAGSKPSEWSQEHEKHLNKPHPHVTSTPAPGSMCPWLPLLPLIRHLQIWPVSTICSLTLLPASTFLFDVYSPPSTIQAVHSWLTSPEKPPLTKVPFLLVAQQSKQDSPPAAKLRWLGSGRGTAGPPHPATTGPRLTYWPHLSQAHHPTPLGSFQGSYCSEDRG